MPNQNAITIRPLAPIVAAAQKLRQTLYTPPRSTIVTLKDELWPNPLQPVSPVQPKGGEPLAFPFNWGQNLLFQPRADAEYSADELKRLAKYPLARICIENNKDMLTRMPHKVQLKPLPGETTRDRAKRAKGDPKLAKLNNFFEHPNSEHNWSEFWRLVLEDMLVTDSAAIQILRTYKGEVAGLRWTHGPSITRLIEEHGWTPQPPSPAYQQVWQGYPRVELTTDQLVYRPRNIVPRTTISSFLYGNSPTEQVAEEIKVGMARLQFVYDFYSEGSIPGGILLAPISTPVDKIKEAQQFLDSDLAGQLAKRRRLQILQGFQDEGKTEQLVFPKEPALADLFDEVHTRKICFAYGTSPQRLMRMMNRASASVAQQAAEEEGTLPWLNWLKGICDHIIQVILKEPDYEMAFDPFHEMDVLKQSQADSLDIKVGLYTRNEIRERRGDEPREEPEAEELNIVTAQGVLPLDAPPIRPSSGPPGK